LVLPQDPRLLLQAGGAGSLGQAQGRGQGDLLRGIEAHIQARAGRAGGAWGDDFAPAGGAGADRLQHPGGELATRPGLSCLALA
jgi:hypothetical protein